MNGQIAQPYYRNRDEGGCFDILGGSEYKFFQKLLWSPKSGESISVTSQIPPKAKRFESENSEDNNCDGDEDSEDGISDEAISGSNASMACM